METWNIFHLFCAGFTRYHSYRRKNLSKHSVGLCWEAQNLTLQGMFSGLACKKCLTFSFNYVTISLAILCLQELCLIRFHPATEEEEVAYVSLFSYFSSRKRFGVVANNNRRIKDLYLIPLGSKDPLPSRLLPFDGPGKHLKDTQVVLFCYLYVICFPVQSLRNVVSILKHHYSWFFDDGLLIKGLYSRGHS